ncbi:DegT/DnrJ/EryC1/StrS family aminotransferase [Virgisporangium ochraceum]|uniref:Aminotransferase DegT n=1 Tax=Virgisporangium ochraceum TaxID=65505 RepID=A0A8J4EHQ7_9ACTN|nr:DegT/DnrJ/EryC1/StrS family aminotransferase [Virgisporangium ochraceum]GIJ72447.1 aminotransferase DegT [Virgisporangium ochraceum]
MTLARDGGTPVRDTPFPTFADASGRTFGPEEVAALADVVGRGTLWRVGGVEVAALEREFAAFLGLPHAVASTSGTAALHLAVAAVDPEPGDEVVVPPITDFGTVIAVLAAGAVPVFADVDPVTGCLTPETVEAAITDRTRAVIVVHLFGGPAPVDGIARICRARNVTVIEDCAQAYLTESQGLAGLTDSRGLAGTRGDIGCFSLQQSKHITAGDGGLTVTADPHLAGRMRLFADKGWPRDTNERTHLFLGFNYRMTELVGAVARVQLTRLTGVVDARRAVARRLNDGLDGLPGLTTPTLDGHSFWLYPLVVDPAVLGTNREFGAALVAEGLPVTPGYLDRPVHLVPALTERRTFGTSGFPLTSPPASRDMRYARGDCPVAERMIDETLLVVACNERFTDTDVADLVEGITKVHAAFTTN